MCYRAVFAAALAACGGDAPTELPVFRADYAATFEEVRDCRFSLDHDLMRIRVLASPDAAAAYLARTPFSTGAIILKEQYDGGDLDCTGELYNVTVMQKLEVGSAPDTLDWTWQDVDPTSHSVQTEDVKRCVQCHSDCGSPPVGFDGTCAMP